MASDRLTKLSWILLILEVDDILVTISVLFVVFVRVTCIILIFGGITDLQIIEKMPGKVFALDAD